MRVTAWFARHDPDLFALRRAGRTAIVAPLLFAFSGVVFRDASVSTFAAFGSFAMLLLVDFAGPMRDRLQAQLGLAVTGAAFVCLGTLASTPVWLAVTAMVVVAFVVLFSGTVSSVLASASTSLLLAFILPVTIPGTVASIAPRLLGWGMASVVSIAAIAFLWPGPARQPLRGPAAAACRALAGRLRADAAYLHGNGDPALATQRTQAAAAADAAIADLQAVFLRSPFRPTGLSTSARTVVRLVDELNWLNTRIAQSAFLVPVGTTPLSPVRAAAMRAKLDAADVLEAGGALLLTSGGDPQPLEAAVQGLAHARAAVDQAAKAAPAPPPGQSDESLSSALDPGFRAQELSHAVDGVARNIALTARAERRTWWQRVLGRQPGDVPGPLEAAEQRASGYLRWNSVWLRNSIRGAAALGIAVLLADVTGVQHSFWVVLGTLSVLRSNALSTGQTALRGILGTSLGVLIGAAVLLAIGTNVVALWILLPLAIFVAGVAPAVISFAAGQAAFTVTLVLLFNIIAPTGWTVGLLRIEDIAIGCGVSLLVGLLFWPRGASAAMRLALAEAYDAAMKYLTAAVSYGLDRCEPGTADREEPVAESIAAAAASRRLDDTFRTYLVERGSRGVPLERVTASVTGVAGLRLASDAIVDIWRGQQPISGDLEDARAVLGALMERLNAWYGELGHDLLLRADYPRPVATDPVIQRRLDDAVAHDAEEVSLEPATVVRIVWTADYLDVVRRLQSLLAPATPAAPA